MWTITDSGNYIIFDNGSAQWSAKKAYLTLIQSGDEVNFFWHQLETGKRFSRRELTIDYHDVTSPSITSGSDLYNQVNAMITAAGGGASWGSITGTLSAQTDLQSALDAKENAANKSTDVNTDQASNIKYPSVKAVYDWATGLFTTASQVATQITTALSGYATQAWVTSQGFITNVITALGFTPLNPANNLSDVNNTSTSRSNLGATTVGSSLFTLTNPSAIRFIRINADNTVTSRTAAEFLSDIGAQASGTYLVASNNLSDLTSAATARTNLGANTVGSNIFTASNPGAIRWIRVNADNTITFRTAAETLSDIGAQASGSYLTASNNLSDVGSASTAKTNLKIHTNFTTSDYTNSTTTLSNVTNASFAVDASSTYYFEFSGNMEAGTASGLRLGITIPSGSTCIYEMWGNNSTTNNFQSKSENYSGGEITQTICAVATTRLGFRIFGTIITGGSSGTVQLQSRAVGGSNTITLYSGLRTFAIKQ